jgi:sarcosine oxidase subunit beta
VGVHGLAIVYYLATRHRIRNVAVLERGYLGCGNSGRNTAIIRSNYRTPEGIPFYEESVHLYELSRELEWNLVFSQRRHLTLAHTDCAPRESALQRRSHRAFVRSISDQRN